MHSRESEDAAAPAVSVPALQGCESAAETVSEWLAAR